MGEIQWGLPTDLVLWLRDAADIDTLVETGTNQGRSAKWAAAHFAQVVTIEGHEPLFRAVSEAPDRLPNIDFRFGDSREILPQIVRELRTPAIFWLDAHWCGTETFGNAHECPVVDELAAIVQSPHKHIILIDDARLFLKPPPLPHRAADWPGISTICQQLNPTGLDRYIAIEYDVIIAVPRKLESGLVALLQRPKPVPPPVGMAQRIGRKLRRMAGGSG